jgi:hypothetical protein
MSCSLKQSKRATSLTGATRALDIASLDIVWTCFVAREHIARQIQRICKEKTNQENDIHEGTSLREEKKIMTRDG